MIRNIRRSALFLSSHMTSANKLIYEVIIWKTGNALDYNRQPKGKFKLGDKIPDEINKGCASEVIEVIESVIKEK